MTNKSQLQFSQYGQRINLINNQEFKVEIGENNQLQSIQSKLQKYTHTRSTAKKLAEIIEDSNDDLKVLLVGDVHSNKSVFVNELLNRQVMPTEYHGISLVNSIIRYGENEGVTAHFFDGQIASFSLDQIELFTVSETFSSQIMREGLDHLDIVVNHELLKKITLFDTPSYRKSIFIKENFLVRSQATVWLVNRPFRGLPSERALLTKFKQNNKRLLFVVENQNGESAIDTFIENNSLYNYFDKLQFSLEKLKQANEKDESVLYETANFSELLNYFVQSRLSEEKFIQTIISRFFEWVDRFILEINNLCLRDPYAEAYIILKEFKEYNLDFIEYFASKNSEIIELKTKLAQTKKNYQELETGHQLMMFLTEEELDTQENISKWIKLYEKYETDLRQYRRKYKIISEDQQFARKSLDVLKEKLQNLYENAKLDIFHVVQHKLIFTENKILEIQTQSEYKLVRLQRATKRLIAFNPVAEAKIETINLLKEFKVFDESKNLIERLEKIEFDYQKLIDFYEEKKRHIVILEDSNKNSQSIYKTILENIKLTENY